MFTIETCLKTYAPMLLCGKKVETVKLKKKITILPGRDFFYLIIF